MSSNYVVHIVDDDEAMRESLALLLETENLACRKYSSAEEFLHALGSASQGCLLLDLQMPGMTGLELFKILHTRKIPMPVIIMTGHGDIDMVAEAIKLGLYHFIEKPFSSNELLVNVHSCLLEIDNFPPNMNSNYQ